MNSYTSDKRILRLIDLLIFQKRIASVNEFLETINSNRSTLSKIRNGQKNHFTVEQIEIICNKYEVNANWIFGIDNKVFRSKNSIIINEE